MADARRDQNRVAGLIAETNDANRTPTPLVVDPVTSRLYVTGTITNQTGLLAGISFDSITATYNSDNDVWVYKLASDTVATITVTFTSTAKSVIQSVVKS